MMGLVCIVESLEFEAWVGWFVLFIFKGILLVTFSFPHKPPCLCSLFTDAVGM